MGESDREAILIATRDLGVLSGPQQASFSIMGDRDGRTPHLPSVN